MIKLYFLARTYQSRVTCRQRCRSNSYIEFAAAPGDDAFIGETQLETAKGDFKSRCRFLVTRKKISHTQCEQIQRAAQRHAELAVAGAAKILNASKKSRADGNSIHQLIILNEVDDLPKADGAHNLSGVIY
jgi:hypothetical protein